MHPTPLNLKDKVLVVLYDWRLESMSESVEVTELSQRVGIATTETKEIIQALLELGFVKTGTPADPSQISTWVKITKAGRDYLREKALVT